MEMNLKHSYKYQVNPLRYSLTTRFKEKHFLKYLLPCDNEKVLDVGCGIGYILSLFNLKGAKLYGMDISLHSLATAKSYFDGDCIKGNGQILPFKDNTFDKIIFADVIEHLPDDNASIQEIVRVCKPNAKIVISTPALEGFITRTWIKHWLHSDEDEFQKDHRLGYTATSLGKLAESNNIKVEKTVYTNYYITELLVGLLKLAFYMKKKNYNSQNDLIDVSNNFGFQLYRKIIFPIFYFIGLTEELIFQKLMKGHCLILCGSVQK